jgi:AmiR/NasT family two-component response regulator
MTPLRAVVTGQHEESRDPVVAILRADGIDAIAACEDRRALDAVHDHQPDVVVMDRSSSSQALELAHLLVARFALEQRLIMLSDLDDPDDMRAALRVGVAEYLIKPVSPRRLIAVVRKAAGEMSDDTQPPTEESASDEVIDRAACRFVDAYNRRDVGAWVAVFHDDVEFRPTMLIGSRSVFRGHAGAASYLEELSKRGIEHHARIRELRRINASQFVLLTDILLHGEVVSPGAAIIKLEDEKIIEVSAYLSDPEILAALDLIPGTPPGGRA